VIAITLRHPRIAGEGKTTGSAQQKNHRAAASDSAVSGSGPGHFAPAFAARSDPTLLQAGHRQYKSINEI
jgi:hypothetical protein